MKLHYKGKYNLNPESLPHGEHMPGAVKFKEAENLKEFTFITSMIGVVICIVLIVPAFFRCKDYIDSNIWQLLLGMLFSLLMIVPRSLLQIIFYKEDVYLYINVPQFLILLTGPETMSKSRFIFIALFPNIVLGLIPYTIGMIFPNLLILVFIGVFFLTLGAGDYYNVFNAIIQMPKGARTYLYQMNSYWYIP